MNLTSQKTQDIICLLDESGSMNSMGPEPVQAINSFIKEQKTSVMDNATFTLYTFNDKVTKVFDDVPLQEMKEFTSYDPDSMTSLYDAIGEAIETKKKKGKTDGVICVILTDGHDNSSTKFTSTSIKKLISEMEKEHNWTFIYLGANQDAFEVGGSIGVTNCSQFNCNAGGLESATRNVSHAISAYRACSRINPNSKLQFNSVP